MPLLSRLGAIAILLLAPAIASASAKFALISKADVVIVGQLTLSSYYLWFDGIHVIGTIRPSEVLYGPVHVDTALNFRFVVPMHSMGGAVGAVQTWVRSWTWAKEKLTQKRIWALWQGSGSEWTTILEALSYGLTDRDQVIQELEERKKADAKPPGAVSITIASMILRGIVL